MYSLVQKAMVLCVVVGCSKRSGRDKDVSFYRIPKIVTNRGEAIQELSRKRRAGFLSAIMRADLTQKVLSNDRICSRHFISGKPATLLDENNPDWLPTLNLGNSKQITKVRAAEQRWERAKLRESMKVQAPEIVSSRGSCLPEGPSGSGDDVSSTSSSDGASLSCSSGDGTGNGSGN